MLCQFSFKNFKSYRDETVFDLQAVNLPEFKESLIVREKASALLPVGVVYGPNGGGKSNLLRALACLISLVVRPISSIGLNRISIVLQQNVFCVPFMMDDTSREEPTEFLLYFRTKANEFRYYLAVCGGEVVSESLSRKTLGGKKPALIFEREESEIILGPSIERSSINTSVNSKLPYFSFLVINYNIPVIVEAQEWFESCLIRDYAKPKAEYQILLTEEEQDRARILHFLNAVDIDIEDYRYDPEEDTLYMKHRIGGGSYELSFEEESDGTKKLIAALPVILLALEEGRLVVIDELDAKLHPKILRYLILMFKNPRINKKGAQLIFTSHDMSTMKNSVFRRDEIWFAAEKETHGSEIYSLHEIRREDNERVNYTAAYDKQYLEGRYGADPYLRNMLTEGVWE